ncbi:MAG: hypothetical protein IJ736_06400 [Firmicutes bacterium]|nr:hypothetical protein [Bacillota bacterium]
MEKIHKFYGSDVLMRNVVSKIISFAAACIVILLAVNISNGNISFKKGPDMLTSATVKNKGETSTFSGVKGNFTVLINNKNVPEGTIDFFTGKRDTAPSSLKCSIANDDDKAEDMIEQLGIKYYSHRDALLMLSQAEYEKFDVIVLSKKNADIYTAKSLYDKDYVTAVEIKGE